MLQVAEEEEGQMEEIRILMASMKVGEVVVKDEEEVAVELGEEEVVVAVEEEEEEDVDAVVEEPMMAFDFSSYIYQRHLMSTSLSAWQYDLSLANFNF